MNIFKNRSFFSKSFLFFPAILITAISCHAMPEQPLNFGWLLENKICGMARPKKTEHLRWLEEKNVGLVVTLTGEGNLPNAIFDGTKLERLYIPVEDFHIPTFEQADLFINKVTEFLKTGKSIVVHCAGGKGRTGTMLACWLAIKENMNPDEAIKFVRIKRPGSVETKEQEQFVRDYFEYSKKSK